MKAMYFIKLMQTCKYEHLIHNYLKNSQIYNI